MLYRRLLILVALILCAVGGAYARTYYLPDYQSQFMYGGRTTETPDHRPNTPKCESYGYYSSMPSGYQCSRAPSPIHGMKCYSCTPCSSSYRYNSSSCSGNYVLSGSSCGGLYNKCLCNRSKFPAEDDSDCPAGQKIDVNQSCTNKSDSNTYYKCTSDPCYSLPSESQCEADGGHCVVSSDCSGKCDECIEYCKWKEQEGAIRCDNGCKSGYQISECSDLCEPGGCRPTTCDEGYILSGDECVPNPCDGYMDKCPAHAICGDTCQSGDTTKYKPTGCETGYELNSAKTACESITCGAGYVLVGSECEPDPCNGFNLTSCPAHAECGTCQSGEDTKYQISGCDTGYELNSAKTACNPSACPTGFATKAIDCPLVKNGGPSLGSAVNGQSGDEPCRECSFVCNSGYQPDSTHTYCEKITCPTEYVYTACPYNAVCETCDLEDAPKYKIVDCKQGYELAATGLVCITRQCKAPYAVETGDCGSVANGYYKLGTETDGWSGGRECKKCEIVCNGGYELNSAGTACEQVSCPTGYAMSTEECGTVANGSYWLNMGDTYGNCKKCVLECAPGYNPDATGTACVSSNCVEPNEDDYWYMGPSDCDIYGNYPGCNSEGSWEFDDRAYQDALDAYEACLSGSGCAAGTATTVEGCGTNPPHGTWSLGSGAAGTCRLCVVNCDAGFTSCPTYVSSGSCLKDKCLPENVCEYRARELGLSTSSTSNGISGSHMFVSSSCYCGTSRPGEYCGGSTGGGRACLRMTTTYEGNTYVCSLDMATGANFGKCIGYNKMSMSGVTTLEQFARNVGTATSVTLFTAEASQQGILTGNICLETY